MAREDREKIHRTSSIVRLKIINYKLFIRDLSKHKNTKRLKVKQQNKTLPRKY